VDFYEIFWEELGIVAQERSGWILLAIWIRIVSRPGRKLGHGVDGLYSHCAAWLASRCRKV